MLCWSALAASFVGPVEPASAATHAAARYLPGLLAYDPSADTWRMLDSTDADLGGALQTGRADGPSLPLAAAAKGHVVFLRVDYNRPAPPPPPSDAADDPPPEAGFFAATVIVYDVGTGAVDRLDETPVIVPDPSEAGLAAAADQVLVTRGSDQVLLDPTDLSTTPVAPMPSSTLAARKPTWTGEELVYALDGEGAMGGGDRWAYRPATNTWRALAPTDLSRDPGPLPAFGDLPAHLSVRQVSRRPSTAWTGSLVAGLGAAYDPAADSWSEVPLPEEDPDQRAGYDLIAWTGQELIVFGGDRYECPAGALCDVSPDADDLVGRRYRP